MAGVADVSVSSREMFKILRRAYKVRRRSSVVAATARHGRRALKIGPVYTTYMRSLRQGEGEKVVLSRIPADRHGMRWGREA